MDLIFYPESESAPNRDKPKGAYVKFRKTFRNFQTESERKDNGPEFVESQEDFYLNIAVAPNIEAIENIRLHQRAMVVGYGNIPQKAPYGEILKHLRNNTELAYNDPNSIQRKNLEPTIRAEIEAEFKAKEEAVRLEQERIAKEATGKKALTGSDKPAKAEKEPATPTSQAKEESEQRTA